MSSFCIKMENYYRCDCDDSDKQTECDYYKKTEDQWCFYNYDKQGISDICHSHEAKMVTDD